MTPEDIKLLGQIFGPQSKINEIPFALGDPRAEEERRRQQALYEAERAKGKQTYSQAPLSDRLMATGKSLGYMGSAMLESMGDPYAKLAGKTTEGALTQYFTPKTPVEGAALSEMANALQPVASFLEDAKIPDITPGMLTSPTRLIDDAARQASMGLQKGAKAAARSTEDILRSEFAKAPVGSIKLPETQREPDVNPLGFYSELGRAADSLRQEKGTGQQFLSQLRSMPGVKADELKWTGLDDFLSKKDKVTKSEIKDYLNANQVQVEEVRLKSDPIYRINVAGDYTNRTYSSQGEAFRDMWDMIDEQVRELPPAAREDAVDDIVSFYRVVPDDEPQTKFQSHSVPGGKNYRELLLTLPQKLGSKDDISQRMFGKPYNQLTDQERFQVTPEFQKTMGQDFRSSHFDQPNILAHMRVSDFEQDGKKIMLVDEIQSDWGQQGRDKGFADNSVRMTDLTKQYDVLNAERRAVERAVAEGDDADLATQAAVDRAAEINRQMNALSDRMTALRSGIPAAPFVTGTEGWVNLTLRRAIQEASEKGFDKVAIPVGSIQADRYNLSKYLSAIDYRKNDDGTYGLIGFDKNDNSVISENRLTEKQLADTIGKEMAQKIIKGEGEGFPDGTAPQREGYKKLAGVDLEVGGEGMKGFYDQIVPKYLNKLGSKFGTKVTRGTIKDAKGNDVPVHEMTITPQMRESVLKKGQPLFAAVPAVGLTQEEEGYGAGGAIKKAAKAASNAPEVKKRGQISELEKRMRELGGDVQAKRVQQAADLVPDLENQFQMQALERAFRGRMGSPFQALAVIDPANFESYASPIPVPVGRESRRNIDELRGVLQSGGFEDVPFLDVGLMQGVPKITGHEGRHRTRAMSKSGIPKTLVEIMAPRVDSLREMGRKSPEEYRQALDSLLGEDRLVVPEDAELDNPKFLRAKQALEEAKKRGDYTAKYAIEDEINRYYKERLTRLPDLERRLALPLTFAAGGAIKKAAKAAKAASKASEVKEQPIYWGMYRGYVGDDVSSTEPQFAAMDRNVAEYYARKRAAQTGLPPHLEMIYKQLDAGRKYGHTVPIDQHNRELLITQAYELQPEDIKGRYQLKKHGGPVKGNI